MLNKRKTYSLIIFSILISASRLAWADGNSVDKVYHPYVLPLETEVEWRAIFQSDKDESLDSQQVQRLGFGTSFIEKWFTEIYIIGEKTGENDFNTSSVEIEAKVQLTEQGEYAADWGLLFELERNFDRNLVELAVGLLVEKEWGRWVGALNLFIEFERRDDKVSNEIETISALQLRYRYSRLFEPALEFYTNQDTLALGPTIMGTARLGIAKKIHWELGVILGLDDRTPDQTIRALLEYEF
jgi:hypothetical protein